ncbi:MAG: Asp-tRNA(Asn)/Glu-tRNA(Gln) amidotransferase subunit GatC [Erysipelotrichaceae bacterium]|jgi:aspartyl-tRNA(Asn)/glutamyl-tRNA(Gln) amidotransferase subunit C|nr:Asp-tRNA(Asn)/Glu-tRNA(Gln) amidotransferase subunit GatC [Bacilli bacterium]NLV29402.1 Asp-tRNA(Asn)/Glu-tRNA(Gln) amidotransferase subunit GatC [Erysipelotrichaceae bacterium]HPY79925.1 Asp-tRNA(Asn)/Glu-tRNA(Gln) amidotransferase subunit GatC [Bacilli bacterium]HQA56005.1 Asp-tRNA(Asn)/Glu-tRNA(Gln) amidotransferase subunit GatC [Bacilli bacterium]
MKKVDIPLLKKVANNLMFDMKDSEYNTLLEEFDVILCQMELISEIPGVDDVEPMTFPFDVTTDFLREDIPTTPLAQEEALKNAGEVVDGQIRLPKVVG